MHAWHEKSRAFETQAPSNPHTSTDGQYSVLSLSLHDMHLCKWIQKMT